MKKHSTISGAKQLKLENLRGGNLVSLGVGATGDRKGSQLPPLSSSSCLYSNPSPQDGNSTIGGAGDPDDGISGALSPFTQGGGGGPLPALGGQAGQGQASSCSCDKKPRVKRVRSQQQIMHQLTECHTQGIVFKCPEGHGTYYAPIGCKLRICPTCLRKRAMDNYHKYKTVPFPWPQHDVLTLKTGTNLSDMIDLALSACRRLRRTFYKQLKYGFYSIEVEYKGKDDDGNHVWYVHIHILANCKWLSKTAMDKKWKELTGSYISKMKRVGGKKWGRGQSKDKAVLECTKYVVTNLPDIPEDAQYELYEAMWGRRLITSWGILPSNLDTVETTLHCKICGNRLLYDGRISKPLYDSYYPQFALCPIEYLDSS